MPPQDRVAWLLLGYGLRPKSPEVVAWHGLPRGNITRQLLRVLDGSPPTTVKNAVRFLLSHRDLAPLLGVIAEPVGDLVARSLGKSAGFSVVDAIRIRTGESPRFRRSVRHRTQTALAIEQSPMLLRELWDRDANFAATLRTEWQLANWGLKAGVVPCLIAGRQNPRLRDICSDDLINAVADAGAMLPNPADRAGFQALQDWRVLTSQRLQSARRATVLLHQAVVSGYVPKHSGMYVRVAPGCEQEFLQAAHRTGIADPEMLMDANPVFLHSSDGADIDAAAVQYVTDPETGRLALAPFAVPQAAAMLTEGLAHVCACDPEFRKRFIQTFEELRARKVMIGDQRIDEVARAAACISESRAFLPSDCFASSAVPRVAERLWPTMSPGVASALLVCRLLSPESTIENGQLNWWGQTGIMRVLAKSSDAEWSAAIGKLGTAAAARTLLVAANDPSSGLSSEQRASVRLSLAGRDVTMTSNLWEEAEFARFTNWAADDLRWATKVLSRVVADPISCTTFVNALEAQASFPRHGFAVSELLERALEDPEVANGFRQQAHIVDGLVERLHACETERPGELALDAWDRSIRSWTRVQAAREERLASVLRLFSAGTFGYGLVLVGQRSPSGSMLPEGRQLGTEILNLLTEREDLWEPGALLFAHDDEFLNDIVRPSLADLAASDPEMARMEHAVRSVCAQRVHEPGRWTVADHVLWPDMGAAVEKVVGELLQTAPGFAGRFADNVRLLHEAEARTLDGQSIRQLVATSRNTPGWAGVATELLEELAPAVPQKALLTMDVAELAAAREAAGIRVRSSVELA